MRAKKIFPSLVICILIIIITSFSRPNFKTLGFVDEEIVTNNFSPTDILRNGIQILSESDLAAYDLPGTGSVSDPFLIENLTVSSTTHYEAIGIWNLVGYHFVIRNCCLTAIHYGINIGNLYNSSVIIQNNNIINSDYIGIWVSETSSVQITNNTIIGSINGIHISDSNYIQINDNQMITVGSVSSYDYGLNVLDCWFGKISDNFCSGWSRNYVIRYASYINFYNNTCESIEEETSMVYLYDVWYSLFLNNTLISDATKLGFFVDDSSNNTFAFNTIVNCSTYAIKASGAHCYNNEFYSNSFLNNNQNTTQCFDYSLGNKWYNTKTKTGNYWSDWIDGSPYNVSLSSNTADLYPLSDIAIIDWTDFEFIEFKADDDFEENDDFDYSKELSLNTYYDLICIDSDYFKISAHRFYYLNITIVTPSDEQSLGISLYASNEAIIEHSWDLFGKDEFIVQCPYTGFYYLTIDLGYENRQYTNYTLYISTYIGEPQDDSYEENDQLIDAAMLTELNTTYELIYTDFDYFRISAEKNANVKIILIFDNTFIDLDLLVLPVDYTGDDDEIITKSETQESIESVNCAFNKSGEYIILVRNTVSDGTTLLFTNYTLSLIETKITLRFTSKIPWLSSLLFIIPIIRERKK